MTFNMKAVEAAITELKKATAEGKRDKRNQAIVGRIADYLLLLKSPSPPAESIEKLAHALRKPLLPLYIAHAEQTLQLSSSLVAAIFEEKISCRFAKADSKTWDQISRWETVQTEIISGILDFLEANDTSKSKEVIAGFLYHKLCGLYLPPANLESEYKPNALLKTTVYTLLHETAASNSANQQKLRDPKILGSKRLGLTLSRTTEYLALEALLTLFARLLPSAASKSEHGRVKRERFIREVLDAMPSENVALSKDIAKVLTIASSAPWEETSVKIIEILSNNISFPQPFRVNSIVVGATTFPQPLPEDRLYLDQNSFFANVDQGNVYETFQASYSCVKEVKMSAHTPSNGQGLIRVIVILSSAPLLGNLPMVIPDGETASIFFQIQLEDVERFLQTVHARGLTGRVVRNHKKVSTAESTMLDFREAAQTGAPSPSIQEKFKTVEQFIEDLCSEGHVSSDPPTVDDMFAPPSDVLETPSQHPMVTNSSDQRQDSPLKPAVTQLPDERRPDISAERITEVKRGTTTLTPPSMGRLSTPAKSARRLLSSPVDSDGALTVLSALPISSVKQAAPRKNKIPPRPDAGSGDDDILKPRSGSTAISLPTAVTRTPTNMSDKTLNPGLTAITSARTTSVHLNKPDSGIPELETVALVTRPGRLSQCHDGKKRKLEEGDNINKLHPVAMDDEGASERNPSPDIMNKRRREPENTPEQQAAATDVELDLVSRKKRLRLQQVEVEQQKTAVPSSKPNIGAAVLAVQQEGVSPNVSTEPNTAAERQDTAKFEVTSTLHASKSVNPAQKPYNIPGPHGVAGTSGVEEGVSAVPYSAEDEKDDELPTTTKGPQPDSYVHSPHFIGAGQIQLEPERDALLSVNGNSPSGLCIGPGDHVPRRHASESRGTKNRLQRDAFLPDGGARMLPEDPTAEEDSCWIDGIDAAQNVVIDSTIVSRKQAGRAVFGTSTPVKEIPPWAESPTTIQPRTMPALKGHRPNKTIACYLNGDAQEPYSSPPSVVTRRLKHNVTFASKRESISPVAFERDFYGKKDQPSVDGVDVDSRRGLSSRKGNKRIKIEDHSRLGGSDRSVSLLVNRDPSSVQDVVDVLDKIHMAIVDRVTGKIKSVKASVQHGRAAFLGEAAADLYSMCAESAEHFNALVDLETEYGTCSRNLVNGIEDVSRTNGHVRQQVQQAIHSIDRRGLHKKLPNSLFPASLEDMFCDLALQ